MPKVFVMQSHILQYKYQSLREFEQWLSGYDVQLEPSVCSIPSVNTRLKLVLIHDMRRRMDTHVNIQDTSYGRLIVQLRSAKIRNCAYRIKSEI